MFRCIQRTIRASECCHHCSALLLSSPLISTQGVLTMGATALEGSEIRHKLKNQCFTSDVTLLIKVCMCIVRMARAEQHVRLCYLMNDPNMNSSWVWAEPGWEAWRVAGDQLRGGGDAAPDRIQAQCAAQTRLPLRRTRAGDGRSDLSRQGEGLNFNIGRTLSASNLCTYSLNIC